MNAREEFALHALVVALADVEGDVWGAKHLDAVLIELARFVGALPAAAQLREADLLVDRLFGAVALDTTGPAFAGCAEALAGRFTALAQAARRRASNLTPTE